MSFLESMFDTLRGGSPRMQESAAGSETEIVRKIAQALDALDQDRAEYIALFAYILGRVANADLDISDEETRAMERIVVDRGGLPPEQAVIAVQIAKTQNRLFGGTENFLATREFNAVASRDGKLALLRCMYAVSAADDSVSTLEDNEIGKVANELHLDRADLVHMREEYRDYLAVLKNTSEPDDA